MKRYFFIFLFISLCFGVSSAKKTASYEDLKAAYIIKFIEQITWKEHSRFSKFKISVLDNQDLVYHSLRKLVRSKRFRNSQVIVQKVNNLNQIHNSKVLFVGQSHVKDIHSIYKSIERKNILLITDQCNDAKYVMLNFIQDKTNNLISFQMNKTNILLEDLEVSSKLILLGGTEIDVRALYHQMKQNLVAEKDKLIQQQEESIQLQQKISEKNKTLIDNKASLSLLQKEIKQKNQLITQHNTEIQKQGQQIRVSRDKMKNLNTKITALQEQIKSKQSTIANQATLIGQQNDEKKKNINELKLLSQMLSEEQKAIDVKVKDLQKHKRLVENQKKLAKEQELRSQKLSTMLADVQNLINKKQELIDRKQNQITENEATINDQVKLINNQKTGMILIAALLILFIALILSVIRAYRIKRNAHDQLEKRVTERTKELDLTNQKLTEEIAERKIAQQKEIDSREKAFQSSKLASLGTLVAGVGHEINNPNEFIMLNTPMLKDVWHKCINLIEEHHKDQNIKLLNQDLNEVKEEIDQMYDDIIDGSNRIKAIVSDLRDYARPDAIDQKSEVDCNQIIQVSVSLMKNKITKSTDRFIMSLGDNLPKIMANRQQIEQVLINLLQNACQALRSREEKVEIKSFYSKEEGYIAISVTDEGIGISKDNLKRIKDPFFTTKRNMEGMGLGLAISSRIMESHQGELVYNSTEGKGTEAKLIFKVE